MGKQLFRRLNKMLKGAVIAQHLKQMTGWIKLPGVRRFSICIIIAFVLLPIIRLTLFPTKFIFNINGISSVFSLEITDVKAVTKWRVNGAIICSRSALPLDNHKTAKSAGAYCGSKSWKSYRFTDPELTLEIYGAHKIVLETKPDGTLYIALRASRTSASVRKLSFSGKNQPAITLGNKVNLIWPAKSMMDGSQSFNYHLFPFTGIATLGRDINWASHGMLSQGKIYVYTSDISSSNKRKLVDQTELVLGDQVRLESIAADNEQLFPKGFVLYKPGSGHRELEIVAFGKARQVRIERYGDNGYDFEPGLWTRILKDPLLIMIESGLMTLLTLVLTLAPVFANKKKSYKS